MFTVYKDERSQLVWGQAEIMKNGRWLQRFILREKQKEGDTKNTYFSVIHDDLKIAQREGYEIAQRMCGW